MEEALTHCMMKSTIRAPTRAEFWMLRLPIVHMCQVFSLRGVLSTALVDCEVICSPTRYNVASDAVPFTTWLVTLFHAKLDL